MTHQPGRGHAPPVIGEPKIQIGDHVLTEAQTMALRVAATTFHMKVSDEEYRQELGEALADAYRNRLGEILTIMSMAMRP
jgi:hypothetical protein